MRVSIVSVFVLCLLLATPYATGHALDIGLIGADPSPNATGEIPAWEEHKNLPCPGMTSAEICGERTKSMGLLIAATR